MDRSKPYRIKNTMLAIQSDWMIDKTTLAIIQDAEPDIIKFHGGDGTQELKIPLQEYIKEHINNTNGNQNKSSEDSLFIPINIDRI